MSIQNNTTELQSLLAAVNALPEAGGEGIVPTGTKQITANGTYDVTAFAEAEVNVPSNMPETVEQATPEITVSSSGKITAEATQAAGYVEGGTKSATKQLTTKGATTITPGTSEKVAVSAGTYVTGDIKVAAVSDGGDSGASVETVTLALDNNTDDGGVVIYYPDHASGGLQKWESVAGASESLTLHKGDVVVYAYDPSMHSVDTKYDVVLGKTGDGYADGYEVLLWYADEDYEAWIM